MGILDLKLMFPTVYVSLSRGFTSSHRGIDLAWNANEGGGNVDLFAPGGGRVVAITEGKDNDTSYANWGNYVKIDHGGEAYTLSGHLLKGSISEIGLKVGDTVKRGQKIGRMNNSGNSFGNHDHFEVYIGGAGTGYRVDPLQYCFVYPHQKVGSSSACKDQIRYLENPAPSGYVGTPAERNTSKDQVEIAIDILHARSGPYLMDNVKGYIKPGIYNVLEIKDMTGEASNGYLWYLVHDGYWCAQVSGVTHHPKAVTPQPDSEVEMQKAINAAVEILKPFVKPVSSVKITPEKMLDISTWQDTFDASKSKSQGISTVICRCGYGDSIKDNRWDSFSQTTINLGMKLGTYGFSTWHYDSISNGNIDTARENMKRQIDSWMLIVGSTPITSWFALDMELESGQSCSFNKNDLTLLVNDACAYIKDKGYNPCVYASASWFDGDNARINSDSLLYPMWIAWYYWKVHPDFEDITTSGFPNNGQLPPSDDWCKKYKDKICAWQFGSQNYGDKYGVGSIGLDKNWLYLNTSTR